MAKNAITDYSETNGSNLDIGGISIMGSAPVSNMDNGLRQVMVHLANVNKGTAPVADTWTFGDPADLTKRARLDAGGVTTGQTRVLAVPDYDGTIATRAGTETLTNKTLPDASTTFVDDGDATKALKFQLSGIATATTRTVTWPNIDGTAMLNSQYPTIVSLEGLALAQGDLLYATAADTLARLAKGTAAHVLTMNAGATAPEWAALPAAATPNYGAGNAALAFGAVGTYVLGFIAPGSGVTEATTIAGSSIQPGGVTTSSSTALADDTGGRSAEISKGGAALSGTWRVMGRANTGGGVARITLFMRIS